MENKKNDEVLEMSENEMLNMIKDTSQLAIQKNVNILTEGAVAAQSANVLANEVEFWQWMNRNYANSGIFQNTNSMQQYISGGLGKEEWIIKQLQGKGYEWDWMVKQRGNVKNVFKSYDAGDVANRMASDVSEKNLITGKVKDYQMKAYTGKTNPHLKNTPKDMTVVTNAEKTAVVKRNGYSKVEQFQDAKLIKENTNNRLNKIKDGSAQTSYNFQNIAGTAGKAGAIGCVIGMGTEAVFSYKAWKNGNITDEQYLKEILKAGGDAGITAGVTAGIMVPVSASIVASGGTALVTVPVAIVVSGLVNKIVAPCFGRGDYKKILSEAKYYQNLENVYDDLVVSMENSSKQYYNFVQNMANQHNKHQKMNEISLKMDKELEKLYNKI